MNRIYTTPESSLWEFDFEKRFLVASGGKVQDSSFEGDWNTGEELDY